MDWQTVALAVLGSGGALAIVGQVTKKVLDLNVEKANAKSKKEEITLTERQALFVANRELLDNLQETVGQLENKNNALELRIEGQRKRIDELITRLDDFSDQNTQLRIQNRILSSRVSELEAELDKHNRKVYYIPKKEGEPNAN